MKKEIYCPDLQKFLSSWKNISRVWSLVIIDQLIKSGVRHFNISPGLRNAPLIKALVAKRREGLEPIYITIGLDERAAAFRALGQAKASGKPSVLICTSGTALANYFPAVIEAKISGVPLIVLSADRPPELVEAGANQSIDQNNLFGNYTRFFLNPGPPSEETPPLSLATSINQAVREAENIPFTPGPVHMNIPLREPLDESSTTFNSRLWPEEVISILKEKQPATTFFTPQLNEAPNLLPSEKELIDEILFKSKKVLIVVGYLPPASLKKDLKKLLECLHKPVYLDVTSSLKYSFSLAEGAIPAFDHPEVLSHYEKEKIDVIIHFGGRLTPKFYYKFLEKNSSVKLISIQNTSQKEDPSYRTKYRILREPNEFAKKILETYKSELDHKHKKASKTLWNDFVLKKRAIIDKSPLTFPAISKSLVEIVPNDSTLFVANSTCIRSFDSYVSINETKNLTIMSHRGASGIEGMIASSWGYLDYKKKDPLTLVIGDISFLHDLNSLHFLSEEERPFVIVVINNGGGGIFNLLPISEEKDIMPFISSPHSANLEYSAKTFGIHFKSINTINQFEQAYKNALQSKKATMIEAIVEDEVNKKIYKQLRTVRLN